MSSQRRAVRQHKIASFPHLGVLILLVALLSGFQSLSACAIIYIDKPKDDGEALSALSQIGISRQFHRWDEYFRPRGLTGVDEAKWSRSGCMIHLGTLYVL